MSMLLCRHSVVSLEPDHFAHVKKLQPRLQRGALVGRQEREAGGGAAQVGQRGGRQGKSRARKRQLAAQAGAEHAAVVCAQAHRVACAAMEGPHHIAFNEVCIALPTMRL